MVNEKTIEIQEKNEELQVQNEEIHAQNEELFTQNELIFEQKTELEKLNKTKDRFFSIIAHDLKNPFNAIIGFSEMLYKNYKSYGEEQNIELIGIIKNSANDAYALFENLLNWSRANLKQVKPKPEKIDIRDITKENFSLLDALAKKKSITLRSDNHEVYAYADRAMINTVIRNLLTNALKFTSESGTIEINAKEENELAIIHVSDNGVGMSKEVQESIFSESEFHTTDGTSGEKGTGIGIKLCKEFVLANNGTIRVESEEGKGSTFVIELPKS
jgi:signal transduction histidine kinase